MGYYMTQECSEFRIDRKDHKDALEAVRALAGKETYGDHFSWVSTSRFLGAKTLADALNAWRWEVEQDEDYNIVGIQFVGEKLGDDTILFKAIAPFVKPGSYIEMHGEDGCLWRWLFDGSGFSEKYAKVVWE